VASFPFTTRFRSGGLSYFAVTADPARLAEAEANLTHYYGTLAKPFDQLVLTGDASALRDKVDAYADAGLDILYLFPVLPELEQLDAAARLLRAF
jgi:hypothetical protein